MCAGHPGISILELARGLLRSLSRGKHDALHAVKYVEQQGAVDGKGEVERHGGQLVGKRITDANGNSAPGGFMGVRLFLDTARSRLGGKPFDADRRRAQSQDVPDGTNQAYGIQLIEGEASLISIPLNVWRFASFPLFRSIVRLAPRAQIFVGQGSGYYDGIPSSHTQ